MPGRQPRHLLSEDPLDALRRVAEELPRPLLDQYWPARDRHVRDVTFIARVDPGGRRTTLRAHGPISVRASLDTHPAILRDPHIVDANLGQVREQDLDQFRTHDQDQRS